MLLTSVLTTAVLVASSTVGGGASAGLAGQAPDEAAGRYIVVLRDDVGSSRAVAEEHAAPDVRVSGVYSHALQGYAAELTPGSLARLRADDRVAAVEPDQVLHVSAQEVPTGVRRIHADQNPVLDIDGQDDIRIDADVAVVDTGVGQHRDLNIASRVDCTVGARCLQGTGRDDNGHGTHVAGTIAALDDDRGVVGVAPGARIHSVKVCGPSGSCLASSILAGVDRVTAQASVIEVVNMSLGGRGTSEALAQAITKSVDAGVVYAVAAGNDSADASGYFPASHPDVITVSALADSDGKPGGAGPAPACRAESQDDHLADFSNFGRVVEVAAPGACILSTWPNGQLRAISGTSMAAPHVAGAAAVLVRGDASPGDRAAALDIRRRIVEAGNQEWTDDSGDGVQEPLLDVHAFT